MIDEGFKMLGGLENYQELAQRYHVKLLNLSDTYRLGELHNKNGFKHIGLSELVGIGSSKDIQLSGEKLEKVTRKFKRPGRDSLRNRIGYIILGNRFFGMVINFIIGAIRKSAESRRI